MQNFAELEIGISLQRLFPYRKTVGDNLKAAIALYEWNAAISAAFWLDIGHLEVFVRNTMHAQLTDWSIRNYGNPRWYDDPARILAPHRREDISIARARLARANKPDDSGRIVAELNFGFWRYLATGHYERTLWMPVLRHGFPYLMGHGKRRSLHKLLASLHDLRNRLAHHEPIHNRPLTKIHKSLFQIVGWIDPTFQQWCKKQSRVHAVLTERPNYQSD